MPHHRDTPATAAWVLTLVFTLCARLAAAQAPLVGVGFDESLSGEPVLAAVLTATPPPAPGTAFLVRLRVDRTDLEPVPGTFDFAALDRRMRLYAPHGGVQVLLDLGDSVGAGPDADGWRRYAQAVATHYGPAVRGYVIHAPRTAARAEDAAFAIKGTAVSLKAGDGDGVIVLGTFAADDAGRLTELFGQDVAAYVDAFGLTAAAVDGGLPSLVETRAPTAGVLLLDEPLGTVPAPAVARFLTRHLGLLGSRVTAAFYVAPPPVAVAVSAPIATLGFLLNQPLAALDDQTLRLQLARSGADVTSTVTHRMLFGLKTAANYLVYLNPGTALDLHLIERTGSRPAVIDAARGTRVPVRDFTYDATAATARLVVPGAPTPLVVDWSDGQGTVLIDSQDVSTERLPSVSEIIARHQQAQGAQDAALRRYVANARMTQSFRATAADPGFDVVTENRFFADGPTVEWEERSFKLNGTRWGANRPAFPLLQAEKVLSLPLDLRLTTDYAYRLDGVERIEGRPCFVLRFDPVDAQRSLYRGTVWIDRATFLKAKVQTVQTRMAAPVLSSEEVQQFSTAGAVGGRDIQLLTRLLGRQTMLVAGRTLAVEREIVFEDFQLNAADFDAQRQASRAGDGVMYRDTDQGLRYLVKKDGERQVSDTTTTSAKALALGVTYDPSFDFPLPLGGINYLDFDFLGKDNQLAVIFGGVVALVNVQRPKILGSRFDASLDLFAIAVQGNDRTYGAGAEIPTERVVTLPFSTGSNLGWQVTQFQRLAVNYQFLYNHFGRDALTDPAFVVPASGVTHGVGLGYDWKRAGYNLILGATAYSRATWRAWGGADDYDPAHRTYLKYSASLTRDYIVGIHKLHFNAAYYGGRDLDRFSKYQFGFFDDNRIHGVPAAGVRFSKLGMFRGSYSFNLFDQYRLDLYLDRALGLDPAVSSQWQHVTGLGLGFNTRGPAGTLLRGDFGKSLLPDRYRQPGSLVFQFQVLKPL